LKITDLFCQYNELNSLDLSHNLNLTNLFCYENSLTILDLSQNTFLRNINCKFNLLSRLDLSKNIDLIWLDCSFNFLACLNLKNGNNINLFHFYSLYNDNLFCIEVDDVNWAMSNFLNVDSQSSFSTNCVNYCSSLGISALNKIDKQVVKIVDLLGNETDFKTNCVLYEIYNDGSVEKVLKFE